MPKARRWDLPHLHAHLQYAVDLELWTIPFYMSALYSIRDPTTDAFQLIQSVVHQEMLHLQLASNAANAFGLVPRYEVPRYVGSEIPHLDFALDHPDPRRDYSPYSAELGPLDRPRINAMCLIEFPDWATTSEPELREDMSDYGSIGELYDALQFGAAQLASHIRGHLNQVSLFERHYLEFPQQTVTRDGAAGFDQMRALFDAIREQGEGSHRHHDVPREFENTADDPEPAHDHFEKFTEIRGAPLPEVYPGVARPAKGSPGAKAQRVAGQRFGEMLRALGQLFGGRPSDDFGATMAATGAAIANCWKLGAIPRL